MKILADQNIPFVNDAFSHFGEVSTINGRAIKPEHLDGVDILLVRSVTRVDRTLLERSNVKFVATATIGTDHIDLDYLKERGIGFGYAPGSNADSVAEYVVTSLLHLCERTGRDLRECTLGIIGVGNVGSRVDGRARILGVNTLLNDPPLQELSGRTDLVPLEELLQKCDIITFHVPLIRAGKHPTFHLVDESFLKSMRSGVVLVNTSRGKVIDENVLLKYQNKLDGLILDVWETEPDINSEVLRITDIATPHIAGYSYDGKVKGTLMIYEAACAYFNIEKQWNIPDDIVKEIAATIEIKDSQRLLIEATQGAYPVLEDDFRMRKIDDCRKTERAAYFDELRKKYPKRSEFHHFRINNRDNLPVRDLQILEKLGFGIC